ncbi:DUF2897 family protein [Vibrio gallicus]|uniref:DUF2897 family protein n=1 Tax=Vibrio gallicus TaxID=190897 RepID=UPI0021C40BC4|nr:DUF2897 family protein [Vibrio gallicus]
MLLDLIFNPWVIIFVVVCIVVGNIAALKHTANFKISTMSEKKRDELERLKQYDEERQARNQKDENEPNDFKDK